MVNQMADRTVAQWAVLMVVQWAELMAVLMVVQWAELMAVLTAGLLELWALTRAELMVELYIK